jgi:hypothetical protein
MKRLPKYKTDPKSAYNYARKHGVYSEEEEKVFLPNLDVALDYALTIKQNRLSQEIENQVFEKFLEKIKNTDKSQHAILLNTFFKYIKLTKSFPKNYLNKFLDNTSSDLLYIYAQATGEKLPDDYEKRMFDECVENDDLWPITEYQYLIKIVPDYMHNFMIAKNLEEKSSSNKNATLAYFLNLKKLKKTLQKLQNLFEDKNIKLKEVIDKL